VAAELSTVFAVWPKLASLRILRVRHELRAVAMFAVALLAGLAVRWLLPSVHLAR